MNLKMSLQSKEFERKGAKVKFVILGFVLMLAFFLFNTNGRVDATSYTINGTNIMGEKNGEEDKIRDSAVCSTAGCEKNSTVTIDESKNYEYLTFIQGGGENNKTYIKFLLKDIPSKTTAFAIVESGHSDSSSDDNDLDRYEAKGEDENDLTIWQASLSNKVVNGILGSAVQTENGIEIVYRIRNGNYGLNYFRIFFYDSTTTGASAFNDIYVYYVISRPIDLVELGDTCNEANDTICTDYVSGTPTRESRELKIFIPKTVAYVFKSLEGAENSKDNYLNTTLNTIYAINYFKETSEGEIETPSPSEIASATQKYLYTNFTKGGDDTKDTVYDLIETKNALYLNYLESYTANDLEYMKMKVDSTGAYFFYITDIFGNVSKDIYKEVTDVKNRSIETKIQKGNSMVDGYDAEETFTNESVKVEITMTVQTNFEFGECLDNMCAGIINLTSDRVKEIRYWRVNVEIDASGNDLDAYDAGELPSSEYAYEKYAADGTTKYLYCLNKSGCTGYAFDEYNDSNDIDGKKLGSGFVKFEENKIVVYVANSGRYRFYIEDTAGNNTMGPNDNPNVGEFRNPRVEVYGIDKTGPEIDFDFEDTAANGLKKFDIETFEYYYGIDINGYTKSDVVCNDLDNDISNCYYKGEDGKWHFVYDARIKDNATTGYIDNYIYYSHDSSYKFNEEQAIKLSKVSVSDYIYKYNSEEKLLYADFNVYNRDSNQYVLSGQSNDRVTTIKYNAVSNSNGLKLDNGIFKFKNITFYHKDNITKVCEKIDDELYTEQYDCVNYYLDHGVDFIIEFEAEDSVGNISSSRVYVEVEDTTPPGFIYAEDKKIGRTNTNEGSTCRIEIGGVIGNSSQTWQNILGCYNVYLGSGEYNVVDNVYKASSNDGLKEENRINEESLHVKLYIKNNDSTEWVDLKTTQFIPNRTGYYDIKIVVVDYTDTEANSLTVLASYYVDKRIVFVEPKANSKLYGEEDPTFEYCMYIGDNLASNYYSVRFSNNPYSDKTIYKSAYCSESNDTSDLFQTDTTSQISGALTRQESLWYNNNVVGYKADGVTNNYVGNYNIILGTLNIVKDGSQNEDYIVKIYPFDDKRVNTKLHGSENGNKIINVNEDGSVDSEGLDNAPFEDDNEFTESSVRFTIKQVVLNVKANGGSKEYGTTDTNYTSWNDDGANSYLNGVDVLNGLKYSDSLNIIKGVLRRKIGENVGVYAICNYRGNELEQNTLESSNNMYIDCNDTYAFDFGATLTYDENGIIEIDGDFAKSRALYIETNKSKSGMTLNTTTETRNNNYANYAINYTSANYIINSIDLIIQVAPGQRREYAYDVTHDPNPWEIILYGLVENNIVKNDSVFSGYTSNGNSYNISREDESDEAKLEVNKSENRTTWYFIYNERTLVGLKTNETYSLIRNTESTDANSAKVMREEGGTGGWYLYKALANDTVVGASASESGSKIAIVANGNDNCSYDITGHIATASESATLPCKNYNLIYNSKYTSEDGYTIENKGGHSDDDFIYKSHGDKCTVLDPEYPCLEDNKYDIQFEIYRRDIIIEFNSALTTFMDGTTSIIYGYRYSYYADNLFKVDGNTNASIEGNIFMCYADENVRTIVDCTNNASYGLTQNDTWHNIGLNFRLSTKVSATNSGYYSDGDKAIPAGVYFVYADINNDQKVNYNFKYKGGTLIIKSKPIDISILDYKKEYGEKKYDGFKLSSDSEWETICILDSAIRNSTVELLQANDYCGAGFSVADYDGKNIYGFYTNDLDSKDTIAENFIGRPLRDKGESAEQDINGMQDSVGIYNIGKGTIETIINNNLTTCNVQTTKGTINEDCTVVTNGKMPNYVINTEIRNYLIDWYNIGDIEQTIEGTNVTVTRSYTHYTLNATISSKQEEDTILSETITDKAINTGKLYITPAELIITVMSNQSKMYGCAYNIALRSGSEVLGNYDYASGYAWCEENDEDYYDLGYGYTVSGDKDYQIANAADFDLTYGASTYNVTGIEGTNFRPNPTVNGNAVRNNALNTGTLYRILFSDYDASKGIKNSNYLEIANKAISGTNKTYQGQSVGTYLIILGSLDAALNGRVNQCDGANNPAINGAYECKNYVINYNGTKVLQGDKDEEQKYTSTDNLVFNIIQRKAYVYTEYNQKIYGDEDPVITHVCNDDDVSNHFCKEEEKGTEITYGVSRYYTKANSLAKAPWTDTSIDDYQTNVISGSLSRKGMGNNNPNTNDIVGYYEYRYDDFDGTVEIINSNYVANYYEDGLAVQEDGTTTMSVQLDGDDTATTKDVKFEIVLRKIKIAFISFDKVYGEKDDYTQYDILVCAPTDTFDFENKRCLKAAEYDPHGLSASHKATYFEEIVNGSDVIGYKFSEETNDLFKQNFVVRYLRAYGENVTCATSSDIKISTTITGNFYNNGNEDNLYAVNLNCRSIAENEIYKTPKAETGKMVYETLAYIDQNSGNPGFNYEVSYTTGYVNIVKRDILITPDSNQGFMYGDYYDTLIPAITYTDSLNMQNLNETYGLVNGGEDGSGVCLNNINYYNNGDINGTTVGTCYNINDRKDEYDSMTSKTEGASSSIDAKVGLPGTTSTTKTYVFGDNYVNESSTRHALNRKYDNSNIDERYNRNVGVYTITQGDIGNETGNYNISFVDGITYEITQATITITPRNDQYKIYGEVDEELKFDVVTKYTITYTHINKDGVIVNAGDIIEINGFAYEENQDNDGYNYGTNKNNQKTESKEINQSSVNGARYFDIACRGSESKGANDCNEDRVLTYGNTTRILLGYLHITWNQTAGKYDISDGFVVALNGLGENKNYNKIFVMDIKFTIIPRPIGVKINDVSKVYGTSTDKDGCDLGISNCEANGLTDEDYLKYNFVVTELEETKVSEILGSNIGKYKLNANSNIISGLATNSNYTQIKGISDDKNSSALGVYVSRDELNTSGNACLYDNDKYGFCEDVGSYHLRLYGYANTIDNLTKDGYQSYRPNASLIANADVSDYYYGTYFGYNPNYFVLIVNSDTSVKQRELEIASVSSTAREYSSLIKSTATLTIAKKDIIIYVNTTFKGEKIDQFTIEQNTKAPNLPALNNDVELDYTEFKSESGNRESAVKSSSSYGFVIWGLYNKQVRTGDKLIGELAYCNQIISEQAYKNLTDNGMEQDYCSSYLVYEDNKNNVNTNLEGYVPIVRDISMLSISNASGTTETGKTGNATYENTNYTSTFYPGALTITKDETKPVVEVNNKDVYIEANAIGEYLFECVGKNKTTTYTDCNGTEGLTIIGKNELNTNDPILKWLNTSSNSEQVVIRIEDFPKIDGCGTGNYACTLSAYYQYTYGKGNASFVGITPQEDLKTLGNFRMWKDEHVNNTGPSSLEELIMTLVSWFGVTSYDEGEYKNGEYLDKQFDKYYYLVIEKEGTNGEFDISRVGNYKVHFYVMDNAGNVSEGNYYDKDGENFIINGSYTNMGTLHIIDTTSPVVGTLNLYNGKVKCIDTDCTKEENWVVAEDTYVAINTLYRYSSNGEAWSEGEIYVDIGEENLVLLSSITNLYIKNSDGTYSQNNALGKYVKISEGKKASALKHYSWSNSSKGIYLTITGGSDNSYTDVTSSSASQWNHYFSRDGGITWFLYDRSSTESYLVLASEGIREIMIKAADQGVRINTATETTVTYITKSYDNGTQSTNTMNTYTFTDSSEADIALKTWEETYTSSILNEMGTEERKEKEQQRQEIINRVGWNQSDEANNDEEKAQKISKLIYGEVKDDYSYYRDKQKAYLDWTLPIIEFINTGAESDNGEKIYIYEFGCEFCTIGYTEKYATGYDSTGTTSRETANQGFNRNYSIFMGTGGDYSSISTETLITSTANSGLGNSLYPMNGNNVSYNIKNINELERKYVVYASIDISEKNGCTYNSSTGYSVCNLSSNIEADNIKNYIQDTISSTYNGDNGKDVTYQIHYSVLDKAGNESSYVSRGIIFANLKPTIEVTSSDTPVEEIAYNTYSLSVSQGDNVEEIAKSLSVNSTKMKEYITQTIYYNGELVVDNKRYDQNIYDGFTTSVPGVYEITYNLSYMHYGENGASELISADSIKLIINVDSTPPIVVNNPLNNYTNIIVIVSLMAGMIFILVVMSKKRKSSF